jgi:hypothetical protein
MGWSVDAFDASLTKSIASKFSGDARVDRFGRREIGAATFRIILTKVIISRLGR